MKRRVRKIANFFAFNLLFFALYLNFIHKDRMQLPVDQKPPTRSSAFTNSVLVENPEQYLEKKNATTIPEAPATVKAKEPSASPLN